MIEQPTKRPEEPPFRPGVERLYEVTVSAIVGTVWDKEPTDEERGIALFEQFREYVDVVAEADTVEHIVRGETSLSLGYSYAGDGTDFGVDEVEP